MIVVKSKFKSLILTKLVKTLNVVICRFASLLLLRMLKSV